MKKFLIFLLGIAVVVLAIWLLIRFLVISAQRRKHNSWRNQ